MAQPPHTVRASADSTVSAKPDRAQVTVGIYSQALTADAASQQNATLSSHVLDALKQVIGSKGQIKTSGFAANPQMQYGKNGGTPKITGYAANNRLTLTLDDLTLVSKVIDTAIQAGATQIEGVTFSLKDDEAVRAQALAQASRKAYDAAQAIAKALSLTVVGVLEAQTGTQAPNPVPMFARSAVMNAPEVQSTPIEAGDIEIHATVTVALEVR
ncbi:MAG TPA: SIMPL domain-containing protein [Bryobacteraceae bacterium]|nr:SIMPL domain-containing protein [Bryobacteraceae bacterium]